MAVVAISDSVNRVEDMETSPTIVSPGAGGGGGTETVTTFQGAQSVSRKVTATDLRGVGVSVTAVDMTTGDDQVWLHKSFVSDFADVNSNGWVAELGSALGDQYRYVLLDDGTKGDRDASAVPRSGWIVEAIDPNVTAWRDSTLGSAPTLTAITHYIVVVGLATGVAKAVNIFLDSVDLSDGLYLVGGDSTDPDGAWSFFVADDEESITAGRFGHALTNASGIEILGKMVRGRTAGGTTTATVFTDSLQSITWVGGRVAAGWNELEDDITNASSVITESNEVFTGKGRDNLKRWFDTANEIDGVNEEIDIPDHGFATGDAVLYSNEGGTAPTGLTNNTEYFVNAINANSFSLHTARADAYNDASRVAMTADGTAANHSFRRQPDTRPVYNATGTGGSAVYTSCNWIRWSAHNLNSKITMTGCQFVNCSALDLNAAAGFTSNTIVEPLLTEGESFLTTSDLAGLSDCSFSMGEVGHAIDIDTAGTYSVTGLTMTGYWSHGGDPGNGAEFTTDSGGINAGTEVITTNNTHGFATGDAVYYNDNTGVASIGLTHDAKYYVNVLSTTTFSLHLTEWQALNDDTRVNLSTSGAETHTFYSSKAAVVNSSNGLVTANIGGGGTTFAVRNVNDSTTTVSNPVTLTLTNLIAGSEVRIFLASDNSELDGIESSGTTFAYAYEYSSDRDIIIRVLHVDYVFVRQNEQEKATNQTIRINQLPDGIYQNP